MRMIKVGEKYLGLVDGQANAIRFDGVKEEVSAVRKGLSETSQLVLTPRVVKLTTLADRTAASMRGLASDVEGDNGGGQS